MIVYMRGRGFKKHKKIIIIRIRKKKEKDMRGRSINPKILKICSNLFDLSAYVCEALFCKLEF